MSPVSHKHARLLGQRLGALLSARRPAEGALPLRLERSDRTHPEPAARVPPQADTRLLPGGDKGGETQWGTAGAHAGCDLVQSPELHHFPAPKTHLCLGTRGTAACIPGPWTRRKGLRSGYGQHSGADRRWRRQLIV